MTNSTRVGPFDPNRGEPDFVYRKLAEHLATRIQTGELGPGVFLSEADLALEYQVSIPTVGSRLLSSPRSTWWRICASSTALEWLQPRQPLATRTAQPL
ncbi:GntR family transcriptional regulator [Phytoactinopolyspora halotolerans]|uniref:GntR family transcriptional regulator n=1 Tax=Phytoactinopolyspora halotolerans TaxID=1981512 RepID=A0A6L9S9C7_9ACTN|nr:GntR family transcriptional regulator [Phytoactinopolyspora halotolerans]NEE01162.1 GntR family transcriptional regulator [Phytoactinopolyspora halotolerans]